MPVVVDVETGGFNAATDALLEIAAVSVQFDEDGQLTRNETWRYQAWFRDVGGTSNFSNAVQQTY